MYQNEEIISKRIVTPDGENEFQVRYIRNEGVGVLCTSNGKSYFLLDSKDYWYDLIQENYPPVMKCSCKNDRFNLTFHYTPRVGTDDFREVSIECSCTVCKKTKRLPAIKIDYSPSAGLLEQPITFCKQPKIKYKTYSLKGYWSAEEVTGMAEYLLEKNLFAYCWCWDSKDGKRRVKELSETELHVILTGNGEPYVAIYFSEESLDQIPCAIYSNEKGVFVRQDIWRKNSVIVLHAPFMVMSNDKFYQMEFCSEYLDKEGEIISKPVSFCTLVQEFQEYSKKLLKKK